jgi:hypothetical protein
MSAWSVGKLQLSAYPHIRTFPQTRRISEKFELYNQDWQQQEGALILRNWTAVPDWNLFFPPSLHWLRCKPTVISA